MAISYFNEAITVATAAIDIYVAKTPKSSGVYNLVNIGDNASGIACAIAVPVTKVIIFFENLDLKNLKTKIIFLCNY